MGYRARSSIALIASRSAGVPVHARVAVGVAEETAAARRDVRLQEEEHPRVSVVARPVEERALRVARLRVAKVEEHRERGARAPANVVHLERVARSRRGLRVLAARRAERDVVEDVDPQRAHLRFEQRERVVLRILEERGVADVLLELGICAARSGPRRARGPPRASLRRLFRTPVYARSSSWCSSGRSGPAFSTAVSSSMAVAKSPLSILRLRGRDDLVGLSDPAGAAGSGSRALPTAEPAGAGPPCDDAAKTTSARSSAASEAAATVTRFGVIHGGADRSAWSSDAPTRDARRPRGPVTTGLARLVGLSARAALTGDGVSRADVGTARPRDSGCSGSAMRPVVGELTAHGVERVDEILRIREARRGLLREEPRDDRIDLGGHVRVGGAVATSSGWVPSRASRAA